MNKRTTHIGLILILALATTLTACGGGGGTASAPPTAQLFNRYVYVSSDLDDQISQFRISDSTGPTAILPAAQTGTVSGPNSITASVDGKYIYATILTDEIDQFSVNANGSLSKTASISTGASTWPWSMAFDPTGQYAYVTYSGSDQVEQYQIGADGALSSPAGPVATGSLPNVIVLTPVTLSLSDQYAYVANSFDDTISQYVIDPTTGKIIPQAIPHNTITTGAASTPLFLAIDPLGRYVYTANDEGTIGQFRINQTDGTLSAITSNFTSSGQFNALVIDPAGKYIYATNYLNDTVNQYIIGTNGSLSLMKSTPTEVSPSGIDIDSDGQFLYVIYEGDDTAVPPILAGGLQYKINAGDGSLEPSPAAIATGSSPIWIKSVGVWQ